MKITFITRTKSNEYEKCLVWLKKFAKNKNVGEFIVISDLRKLKGEISGKPLINVYDEKPNKAKALNKAIQKIKEENNGQNEKYFIIASKEVELQNDNIDCLRKIISSDEKILVAGYRLKDNILTNEEYNLFSNYDGVNDYGIAYMIPWNTCAIWNYDLFKEYVVEFDDICSNNQLGKLIINMDGCREETEYEGMEDGLAVLKALNKKSGLKSILLKKELFWNIPTDKEERVKNQKLKMARKNIVLSTFANIRGYSIDKLK